MATIEQKIILIYTCLGIAVGPISNFFTFAASPYRNLAIALLLPLAIYFASLATLVKTIRQKKIRWLVHNSFMTFVLVWLVTWIFLYNIVPGI